MGKFTKWLTTYTPEKYAEGSALAKIENALVKGAKGTAKFGGKVALIGIAAGTVVGVGTASVISRKSRSHSPHEAMGVPEMPPMPAYTMAPQADTMMGLPPAPGEFARREEMRRSGMAAGVDPSIPSFNG